MSAFIFWIDSNAPSLQSVWMGWIWDPFLKMISLCLNLPAEQFHEVLEAIFSEEVEGALRRAQVDEQEDEQDDGQKWNQQVPAGC